MSASSVPSGRAAAVAKPQSLGGINQIIRSTAATAAIVVLVTLWPIAVWNRVSEIRATNLGFQLRLTDPLLVFGGLLLFCLLLSLAMTGRPLRRYWFLNEIQTGFRDAVAVSYFGRGHYAGWTQTNPDAHLGDLEWPVEQEPDDSTPDQFEQPMEHEVSSEVAAAAAEPAAPVEVTDYKVQRRDSWWRIAETQCGDTERWEEIRDLNIGLEVEPGVVLDVDTPLRSGWVVKVPVQA